MADGRLAHPADDRRHLLLGILAGLGMVGAVAGLVLLVAAGRGYLPSGAAPGRAVVGADAAGALREARPTAAWRFRSEWLTPGPE